MASVRSSRTSSLSLDALLNVFEQPKKSQSQFTVETTMSNESQSQSDDDEEYDKEHELAVVHSVSKVVDRRSSLSFVPASHNRTTLIRTNKPVACQQQQQQQQQRPISPLQDDNDPSECCSVSQHFEILEEAPLSPDVLVVPPGSSKFRSRSCGFLNRRRTRVEDMTDEQLMVALVEEEAEIDKRIEREKRALRRKKRKEKDAAEKAAKSAARRQARRSSMVATTTTSSGSSPDKKQQQSSSRDDKKKSSSGSRSKSTDSETLEDRALRKAASRQRRASMAAVPVPPTTPAPDEHKKPASASRQRRASMAAVPVPPEAAPAPEEHKQHKKTRLSSLKINESNEEKVNEHQNSKDDKTKKSKDETNQKSKDSTNNQGDMQTRASSRTVERTKNFLRSLSPTRLTARRSESPAPPSSIISSSPRGNGKRSQSPSPWAGISNMISLSPNTDKTAETPKLTHPQVTAKLLEEDLKPPSEKRPKKHDHHGNKKAERDTPKLTKESSARALPGTVSTDPLHILYLEQRKKERAARIEMARSRIKEQQKLEAEKFAQRPEDERRQAAYAWYMRLGMPNQQEFKYKVRRMHGACDMQEDDVDLLPWLPGGKRVSAKGLFTVKTPAPAA